MSNPDIPKPSSTPLLKYTLRVLFASVLFGVLLVTLIGALHDPIAHSIALDTLAAKGVTCPEDTDIDLRLADWTLDIQPTTCTYAHQTRRATIQLTSAVHIRLNGFAPKSVQTDTLRVDLHGTEPDRKTPSTDTPKPTTSNPLLKPLLDIVLRLDPRPTADRVVLALANIPHHEPPPMRVKKLTVSVGDIPEAVFEGVALYTPAQPDLPYALSIQKGQLATRSKGSVIAPRADWIVFTDLNADIAPKKIHFSGRVQINTNTLLGSVRVPARIVADVTNLEHHDPTWTFNALPGL